jgi:hypothetical protein
LWLLDGNLAVSHSQERGGTYRRKGDTMASDRRPVIKGPDEAWKRLGELLQLRRAELGYKRRPAFTKDRGINIRLVTDIENAYRPNTFLTPTLREIAQAYAVTYDSVVAVVFGHDDELIPEDPAAPPSELPEGVEARSPAAQDYADQIWGRLLDLADRGITRPSGRQLFPDSPADARTWDDPRLQRNWTVRARVRMIADLQYLDARPGRTEQGNAG